VTKKFFLYGIKKTVFLPFKKHLYYLWHTEGLFGHCSWANQQY